MSVILRFSGSSNFAAMAVKLYTWSWCSHVETIIDTDDNRKVLYGALPTTGVNYRPIESTVGDRVEDYEIKISQVKKHIYIQKILSQRGKPYDFTALAGMVLHRDWAANGDSWFCSELVAWAFSETGCPLLRVEHKNRVTPEHLLMSPFLKRVA